jgi:hypothetical protein
VVSADETSLEFIAVIPVKAPVDKAHKSRFRMKQYQKAYTVLMAVTLFFLGTHFAWAEPEPVKEGDTSRSIEAVAETSTSEAEEAVEATGLDIVLDGSSLATFEQGLEEIKKTCTTKEYSTLEKSIDYLLTYDLVAKRNKEILAQRLDSMTGRQIIEKVNHRRNL